MHTLSAIPIYILRHTDVLAGISTDTYVLAPGHQRRVHASLVVFVDAIDVLHIRRFAEPRLQLRLVKTEHGQDVVGCLQRREVVGRREGGRVSETASEDDDDRQSEDTCCRHVVVVL